MSFIRTILIVSACLLIHSDHLKLSCEAISSSSNAFHSHAKLHSQTTTSLPADSDSIDEQLYSRQLYVYGKSAQKSLMSSNVVVIGKSSLTAEVIKNLALSGIGKILIYERTIECLSDVNLTDINLSPINTPMEVDYHLRRRIQGNDSLTVYAQALNPNIEVNDLSILTPGELFVELSKQNVSTVVLCDHSLHDMKVINDRCRDLAIKSVQCRVNGVCGLIFNDFLRNFIVEDADGEVSREIPLVDVKILLADVDSSNVKIQVTSIDEERLVLGLGDKVEIKINSTTSILANVYEVVGTHVAHLEFPSSIERITVVAKIRDTLSSGRVSIVKMKTTLSLDHKSLGDQLRHPTFIPCNECLAPRNQKALSYSLLACFKAFDKYFADKKDQLLKKLIAGSAVISNTISPREFKNTVLAKLVGMGIKNPEDSPRMGGVGIELLDKASFKFFVASRRQGQCPATVSVVGALTAQEVIKSCSRIHTPATQFLMFESFDTLPPLDSESIDDTDSNFSTTLEESAIDQFALDAGSLSHTQAVYGEDIAQQLARLKVFVIGSGAIGCELLKTFAMLGLGQGAGITADQSEETGVQIDDLQCLPSLLQGLHKGGILLTDMDHIERSNLNRQLLFREKHIGRSKSEVAAETIKDINSQIKVRPLSKKVSLDTEEQFPASFWREVDVIATALDNVDARKYVDQQSVFYKKWLIDSGTLGTKGNVQVVIPYESESYSSSADPPDEAIPLCTLKSFPYQSEHCIAWGRSMFDQLFVKDIQFIRKCLEGIASVGGLLEDNDISLVRRKAVDKLVSITANFEEEDAQNILYSFRLPPTSPERALYWSIGLCNKLFNRDITLLLKKHPSDSLDDEGLPFWSGSRRIPSPVNLFHDFICSYNGTGSSASNINTSCRDFVIHAAWLRSRLFGYSWTLENLRASLEFSPALQPDQTSILESELNAMWDINSESSTAEAIVDALSHMENLSTVDRHSPVTFSRNLAAVLKSEDFEKDDLSLGHVDVVTQAANIRCQIYGLPEVNRLEVQKVAGRIVPALATTTAIVSGLATMEIIKLAGELTCKTSLSSSSQPNLINEDSDELEENSNLFSFGKNVFKKKGRKLYSSLMSRFHAAGSDQEEILESAEESEALNPKQSRLDKLALSFNRLSSAHKYEEQRAGRNFLRTRSQFVDRFRNSFINVARPMLAFATPVEAAVYIVGKHHFTMWDVIELPPNQFCDLDSISVEDINQYLKDSYNVVLQSVAYGDILLYADFMRSDGTAETSSIKSLLRTAIAHSDDDNSDIYGEGSTDLEDSDRSRDIAVIGEKLGFDDIERKFLARGYLDFEVTCSDAETGEDLTWFPPIRIGEYDQNP